MMLPKRLTSLATVAALSLVLAACSDNTGDTGMPPVAMEQPSVESLPAITTELGPIPVGQTNRADRWRDPSPNSELMVTGVSLEDHADYEALIFQLSGPGVPGWFTYSTAEPTEQATGNPLEYQGNWALQVLIIGTPYPTGTERDAEMLAHGVYPGGSVVRSVDFVGVVEAQSQFIIGLDEDTKYHITYDRESNQVIVEFLKEDQQ